MRHFKKKVSKIKHWTGRESKELMKQFLPVLVGSGCDPDFIEMVHVALDFMYYAHAAQLTTDDLEELEYALQTFHRLKKVVVRAGIFEGLWRFDNIPKIHMLLHYAEQTRELGTPDGFNTESPEHLHIIYAKTPYRASNKVAPTRQMIKFIEHQDALRIHKAYLNSMFGPSLEDCLEDDAEDADHEIVEVEEDEEAEDEKELYEEDDDEYEEGEEDEEEYDNAGGPICYENVDRLEGEEVEEAADEVHYPSPAISIAKRPTRPRALIQDLVSLYGAEDFMSTLTKLLTKEYHMPAEQCILSPHHVLPVWHRLSLHHRPLPFARSEPVKRDVVRARPAQPVLPEAFDTILFEHAKHKLGLE
ncbi:hypothetical protein FRC10_002603, partial [Ceratobasidium sp. 414]